MIKKHLFLIPLIILFFSACFSPWQGDEGTLTLQLGPGNSGRLAVLPEEQSSLSYTITLTGPGQTITETFPAGTTAATFRLRLGTWNVTVKGRGAKPVMETYYHFPDVMLRAYGEKTIAVEGGRNISESITMFPAVEVASGDQFGIAFRNANTDGKEFVFITKDITVNSLSNGIVQSGQNIELRAEKPVRIERESKDADEDTVILSIENGGTLTLGKEGETNQYLQISGDIDGDDQNEPYATAPLIEVNAYYGGAALVMYDALIEGNTVKGFDGGGVQVENGGQFTMYGGYIEGNEVFVNDTNNNGGSGGQVWVDDGSSFKMHGGTLSGKGSEGPQAVYGAGVYIAPGGTFEKTGGVSGQVKIIYALVMAVMRSMVLLLILLKSIFVYETQPLDQKII